MRGRFSNSFEPNAAGERGTAIVLFTLMTGLVVLPMIGLAIDGGLAYLAHERLVNAADAAALAGARSLNIGLTIADQQANVVKVAKQYFNANFPPGLVNSQSTTIDVPLPLEVTNQKVTVKTQVSAVVNTFFLSMIGHPTMTLYASSATSRRDVNVVLALDRSGSMGGVCGTMKQDAQNFVSKFVNGRDTVGLVTFMGNASVDYAATTQFASNRPSLNDTLATLECGGNTGSAAALTLARQQLTKSPDQEDELKEPGALNVIVFFTDGVPNGYMPGPAPSVTSPDYGMPLLSGKSCAGSTTRFVPGYIADGGGIFSPSAQPITSTSTPLVPKCPVGSFGQLALSYAYIPDTDAFGNSGTASGYAAVRRDANNNILFSDANSDALSKNAADAAALRARNDNIVIYAIGLGGNGGVDSTLLKRIANDPLAPTYNSSQVAGKYYYSPNAGQLNSAFNAIASEVLRISQ